MAISNVRASGSYVRGTNGKSNGLIPMLRTRSSSEVPKKKTTWYGTKMKMDPRTLGSNGTCGLFNL